MNTGLAVCEQCLKWNHLSCTFLKKIPKVDIEKLILKIGIENRAKWSTYSIIWQQDPLTTRLAPISDMRPLIECKKKDFVLKSWINKSVTSGCLDNFCDWQ